MSARGYFSLAFVDDELIIVYADWKQKASDLRDLVLLMFLCLKRFITWRILWCDATSDLRDQHLNSVAKFSRRSATPAAGRRGLRSRDSFGDSPDSKGESDEI